MKEIFSHPSRIRLGTYNVHKMVDAVNDPNTKDPLQPKSEASMSAVATIIRDSQTDIISLQEIENVGMLHELRNRGGLAELYPYYHFVEGNDTVTGFDVAIMSKYPILRNVTHKDRVITTLKNTAKKFKRDLLQVDVKVGDKILRAFATHFVRQVDTVGKKPYYDAWRLAEAQATSMIVREQSRDYPTDYFAIMGDFNFDPDDPEMKVFTESSGYLNTSTHLAPSWGTLQPHKQFGPRLFDHIIVSDTLSQNVVSSGLFQHPDAAEASDHSLVYADILLS